MEPSIINTDRSYERGTEHQYIPYDPYRYSNSIPSAETLSIYGECDPAELRDFLLSLDTPVRKVRFDRGFEVHDGHLNALSGSTVCTQIEVFILTDPGSKLSSRAIQDLARACTNIKILILGGVAAVDDPAFLTIAENCHALEYLELSTTPGADRGISDYGIISLDESVAALDGRGTLLPKLEALVIPNHPLSGEMIGAISRAREGLAITGGAGGCNTWFNGRPVGIQNSPAEDDEALAWQIMMEEAEALEQTHQKNQRKTQKRQSKSGNLKGKEALDAFLAPHRNTASQPSNLSARSQARASHNHDQGWWEPVDPQDPGLVQSLVKSYDALDEPTVRDNTLKRFIHRKRTVEYEASQRRRKWLKRHPSRAMPTEGTDVVAEPTAKAKTEADCDAESEEDIESWAFESENSSENEDDQELERWDDDASDHGMTEASGDEDKTMGAVDVPDTSGVVG